MFTQHDVSNHVYRGSEEVKARHDNSRMVQTCAKISAAQAPAGPRPTEGCRESESDGRSRDGREPIRLPRLPLDPRG